MFSRIRGCDSLERYYAGEHAHAFRNEAEVDASQLA